MLGEAAHPVAVAEHDDACDGCGGCSLYPTYFGASCAFLALHLLSAARAPDLDGARRGHLGALLLRGGAALLGLLVWRAQRGGEALAEGLRRAQSEVAELKRIRAEDARANEKVVGIFAAHEQGWIAERKRLRLQIQALLHQFRVLEAGREEAVSDAVGRIEEKESVIRSKDEALQGEARRRTELEEELRAAGEAAGEAREGAAKAAQDHAAELWRHKTAFVELVSAHRQLQAEAGRALRGAEAARRELEEALEEKGEAVAAAERLSEDVARMREDAEQKDKILSAMLRKSKLDTAEKEALLKEVRLSKARTKQAELEVERLRTMAGGRHRKGSTRGFHFHPLEAEPSHLGRAGFHTRTLLLDYLEAESANDSECSTPEDGNIAAAGDELHRCSSRDGEAELVSTGIRHLQDWVRSETEKYASALQRRHYAEIEAFTEQLRVKDEKLEGYRWRLLSMELEAKRLQSHVDGLDGNLSQLREENIKLETLWLDRDRGVKTLHLHLQHCRKNNPDDHSARSSPFPLQELLPEVRIAKNRVVDRGQELGIPDEESPEVEGLVQIGVDCTAIDEVKQIQFESQIGREEICEEKMGSELTTLAASPAFPDQIGHSCLESAHQERGIVLSSSEGPVEDAGEEREVKVDPGPALLQTRLSQGGEAIETQQASGPSSVCDNSPWKMDLHALGISYKIKRLKQQLLVLEKLAAAQALKQPPGKDVDRATSGGKKWEADEHKQLRAFLLVMSLLNKQVKRYQTLEEKIDDLCKRMVKIPFFSVDFKKFELIYL
uniref:E3 ubiquitin-protein ligase BRE1 n=1 Tax=Anthurium amnicola TaxID=1678845 RepID=A0A1D1XGS2_9ARAE